MSDQPPTTPRGNPPNLEVLAERLKDRLPLWNEVRETVLEMGATWKWAYSERTHSWSYRSYLAGDRFFAALTPTDHAFEMSLNMTADEWDSVTAGSPAEQALLDDLRTQALATESDPAWLHVPVTDRSTLSLLAKILVTRARRVQKPRLKTKKRR